MDRKAVDQVAWCEYCQCEQEGACCPVCGGVLWQEMIPENLDPAGPYWRDKEVAFDSLRSWPKGPDGEPEAPARLSSTADFESYAGLTISRLEANGIPVLTQYPEGGQLGKIVLGFSGYGVDLFVPESRLEQAKRLLIPLMEAPDGS